VSRSERLTPTSYIVLGLIDRLGPSTPYELKQAVVNSVGHFWSLPHSQLYAEPQRLARAGYLHEEQESTGRRRRRFSLTERGRAALEEWLSMPSHDQSELRDIGLLKLYFGSDPAALASSRLQVHRAKLQQYQALNELDRGRSPAATKLVLESGLAHERLWIEFWERIAQTARASTTNRRARSRR
jgi:DNA-binding PadR family transcriptional regulator